MISHKKLLFSALSAFALAPSMVSATPVLGSDLLSFSILAGEYVATGEGSQVTGNVGAVSYITHAANTSGDGSNYAGGYIVTGANFVGTGTGSNYSGSYIATGAGSSSTGSNYAVGYIETGANSVIDGSNYAGSYITPGAGATSLSNHANTSVTFTSPVSSALSQLTAAQTALNALNLMPTTTTLAATMSGFQTLNAGVYNATALTTAASTTITLDGQGDVNALWLFNIDTYLSTGASTLINIINSGAGAQVIWNTGGYASFGASTKIIGTVLAGTYIVTGADTTSGTLLGSGYVTLGANSKVSCLSCVVAVAAVPEPETYGMMLMGLGLMGFVARRRKNQQI